MVEEQSVGGPVDRGATEAQSGHAPFQFVRGRLGILHGEVRERREPIRLPFGDLGQSVVIVARKAHTLLAGQHLGARAHGRQHLHGNSGFVHRADAFLLRIVQGPVERTRRLVCIRGRPSGRDPSGCSNVRSGNPLRQISEKDMFL